MKRFSNNLASGSEKRSRRDDGNQEFIPLTVLDLHQQQTPVQQENCDGDGIPRWVHEQAVELEERQRHQTTSNNVMNDLARIDALVDEHIRSRVNVGHEEEEDSPDRWLNTTADGREEDEEPCQRKGIEREPAALMIQPIRVTGVVPRERHATAVRRADPAIAPLAYSHASAAAARAGLVAATSSCAGAAASPTTSARSKATSRAPRASPSGAASWRQSRLTAGAPATPSSPANVARAPATRHSHALTHIGGAARPQAALQHLGVVAPSNAAQQQQVRGTVSHQLAVPGCSTWGSTGSGLANPTHSANTNNSSSNSVQMASSGPLPRPFANDNTIHQNLDVTPSLKYSVVDGAFDKRILVSRIENPAVGGYKDPIRFLNRCLPILETELGKIVSDPRYPAVKCRTVLVFELTHPPKTDGGLEEISRHSLWGSKENSVVTRGTSIAKWFQDSTLSVLPARFADMDTRGSGKALRRILYLEIRPHLFDPLNAGSSYIDLPEDIMEKQACINVKNKRDNACFAWAILACERNYDHTDHPQRPSTYGKYLNVRSCYNFDGIKFPVGIQDISRFEAQNTGISVHVFGLEKVPCKPGNQNKKEKRRPHKKTERTEEHRVTGPLYFSKFAGQRALHVNMLLFGDDKGNYHYVWIKQMSRLIHSQVDNRNGQKHICLRCLNVFWSSESLAKHEVDCALNGAVRLVMPTDEEKFLKFKNYEHQERCPFVVYSDFESLLVPMTRCEGDPSASHTTITDKHVPYAAAYQVVCSYDSSLNKFGSYIGDNPANWLLSELQQLAWDVDKLYSQNVPMTYSQEDEELYNNAIVCHICDMPLDREVETPRRDHSHLTGKFRGACHNACNLNYQVPRHIPIFFHNLTGYDSHFLIEPLSKFGMSGEQINIIPDSTEKYISFSKRFTPRITLRFLDSLRFMSSSLQKLVETLPQRDMHITRSAFSDDVKFQLLTRKGVFPYEYVDSIGKLQEPRLPDIASFTSSLSGEAISDEDYAHAVSIWHEFNIPNLGEYSRLYMNADVRLLADVFEKFRDVCMETYSLDPAQYYTAPGLSWDAMLRKTRVNIELLTDVDMLLFFERGVRGGLCQCIHRHAKANNPRMGEIFNALLTHSYIMYLDVNNLYGYAMQQSLPIGGFQWLSASECEELGAILRKSSSSDGDGVPADSDVGYVVEADLEYPDSLHDKTSDLPLCPEQLVPRKGSTPKLLTTLGDKQRYIIHYRNLQQCLRLGMKLIRITRAISFKQSPWLKEYIDVNTAKRVTATSDFEKDFYKLMNNAIFGKTMENVRKHRDIKIRTEWGGRSGARKLIARPNFKRVTIFNKSFVAVEMGRTAVEFMKPIYVGMCILELSKLHMYRFHYEFAKTHFMDPKLLYMDTDSFVYHVKGCDPYEVMKYHAEEFDTSGFAVDNPYGIIPQNKKVIGLMKDESSDSPIVEFVGLRPKMYAYRTLRGDTQRRAKGVKRSASNVLMIEDYLQCLYGCVPGAPPQRPHLVQQRSIQSRSHEVYTVLQSKIGLSPHDDKRVIREDGIETLPYSHYKLQDSGGGNSMNEESG